jgi:hypothetical protein
MKFRLVYRGALASGSNSSHKDQKNRIRRVFHKQLAELWTQHAGLRGLSDPTNSTPYKHKKVPNFSLPNKTGDMYNFLYLIGDAHGISSSLDILFLRRESAGGLVRWGGDLDNRLKILFDALRAPQENNEVPDGPPASDENPFFCTLQDDKYIDRVNVTTDRLLSPIGDSDGEGVHDVLLVIEVQTVVFDVKKADWWVTTDR